MQQKCVCRAASTPTSLATRTSGELITCGHIPAARTGCYCTCLFCFDAVNGEPYNACLLTRLLATAREAAPGIHVHAFSPLEVAQGAAASGWSLDT